MMIRFFFISLFITANIALKSQCDVCVNQQIDLTGVVTFCNYTCTPFVSCEDGFTANSLQFTYTAGPTPEVVNCTLYYTDDQTGCVTEYPITINVISCCELTVIPYCEVFTDDDGDNVHNTNDNCPNTANADQADLDGDGIGDVCDDDIDGDCYTNAVDCNDNDASIYQYGPCDDGSGLTVNDYYDETCTCVGENADADGDGIPNDIDNCPFTANADQLDTDEDGEGDVCEDDTDGDCYTNDVDCDDTDPLIYPYAPCNAGASYYDENCNCV